MPRRHPPLLLRLLLVLFAAPMLAQAQAAPDTPPTAPSSEAGATPSGELPAICTDRPTKGNAACTVEPGHFQYEADIFNGAFTRLDGVTTDVYLATSPTLKYGVSKTVDVEANLTPYEVVRTSDRFGASTLGGVGDLVLRLKWNLFNSADGKLSVGAIPYLKAPIARAGIGNGAVEDGLIVPIGYKLTDRIVLSAVPEFDDLKDAVGPGRHAATAQSFSVGYSLPHAVTVYGELYGDWNFDPAGTIRQYTADVAASWGITKYLQVDAGLNFGINRYAPGVQVYFGIAQKF